MTSMFPTTFAPGLFELFGAHPVLEDGLANLVTRRLVHEVLRSAQ
jgi:hypothetical protein